MNPDTFLQFAGICMSGMVVMFVIAVWANRTSKSAAERKALLEIYRTAVSASPLRALIRWFSSRDGKG